MKSNIIIYQGNNGEIALKGDLKRKTIWASQTQIVDLFGVDQSVISRHIRNIFKDGEIEEKSNMQKMHIPNSDKPVVFYSLDVILTVGYRTNPKAAIDFRKWVTKTLRQHIVKGYTLNRKRIARNYYEFSQAAESVQKPLQAGEQIKVEDTPELIKMFANTWLSLDAYDKSQLPKTGASKKQVLVTAEELSEALMQLKSDLLKKQEASELFGQERNKDAIAGIVGSVFQSVFRQDAYKTLEEKAAHLLYFIVKDHPFVDGNKRSGAFAFVWFLNKAGLLRKDKITPETLTALTLFVAESLPQDKERVVGLILQLLIQ